MSTTSKTRAAVLEVAARQHGLFSTDQAKDAGMTRHSVNAWARSGAIASVRPGVWAVAGAPPSPSQDALAALLGVRHRSVLAINSAAWVWALPGHALQPLELVSLRDRHQHLTGRTHTSTVLESVDVTLRDGLPVTTPTRTIFDLAGRQHPDRTRRDLNNLMGRGLITPSLLHESLDRRGRRGRRGITLMRELVDDVDQEPTPTESGLERRVRDILQEAGFTTLDQQVVLGDDHGFIARVDFCDRSRGIVFEIDSDRYHRGLVDRMLDEEKSQRLRASGWTVVRITEHEIFWRRAELLDRLRAVRHACSLGRPR